MIYTIIPIGSGSRAGFGVKDTRTGEILHRYRGASAQQKAQEKAAALNGAAVIRKPGHGESGNVFFMLFASVALVGVLGVAITSTVRGPLSTAAGVNLQVRTDSRLMIAGRLAAQAAAQSGIDCDGDGLAEPLPPAMGPECADAGGAGGGCIPVTVGGEKADPWGSPVLYCAYDHGTGTMGCPAGLRAGEADPTGKAVLAVVSAGPDRIFQTTCADAPGYVTRAGDDRAYIFDESEAAAAGAGGGLWALVSGDPNTATIDKDLSITTGATFGGDVVFSSSANLTLGGSFLLPDDSAMTICNGPNKGALRVHDASANVQICDGAGNWLAIGNRALGVLDDVPDSYAGSAGAFLRVRGDETGIRFGSAALLDLADVPASYAGAAGRFLRVDGGAAGVVFGSASFLDLADAPGSYAGAAGFAVVVNGGGNGLSFVSSSMFTGPQGPQGVQGVQGVQGIQGPAGPAGADGADGADAPDNFLGLTDTPASYAGQGGKTVRVNAGATALEFGPPAPQTFLALTDTPASYAGQGGKVVKVNPGASALEFGPAGGALSCTTVVANSGSGRVTATCGAGYTLMGGGCDFTSATGSKVMAPGGMGGGDFYYNTTTASDFFCDAVGSGSVRAFARCCQIL